MLCSLILGFASATCPQDTETGPLPALVPTPVLIRHSDDPFEISSATAIVAWTDDGPDSMLVTQARLLSQELQILTGLTLPVIMHDRNEPPPVQSIHLELQPTGPNQNPEREDGDYSIGIFSSGCTMKARSTAGMAHAIASLLQLVQVDGDRIWLPGTVLQDRPAYPYRTILIDVARNPHSIAVLEDVVRLMHLYKLRFLHLHLTDDQLFTFPFAPVTDKLENNSCYTRAELKGLIDYAAVRGITIIPEIDLPGHSSRLRQSGYLPEAKTDRDVASEQHFDRIAALLNEVMDVFDSSPYFHIGGDESGAGDQLLPFLGRVQKLVRARGKRLIVWEGFHGAPTDILPASGADRVVVAAWESSYNAPWDLLNAGYPVINASWKPLYVVGSHNVVHPGSSGGRKWSPLEMAGWPPNEFWHWEPGRPVFEDRGPKDPNRDDQVWNAEWIDREDQIIGSQISVWEQRETSVIHDLRFRLPVFAERVWSRNYSDADELLARVRSADQRVFGIVQPIEIERGDSLGPITALFDTEPADGVALRNRTALKGEIRYTTAPFQGNMHWLTWGLPQDPTTDGETYQQPISNEDGFMIRAQLIAEDGQPVQGTSWARFLKWPDRVAVTEFDIGSRTPKQFPDFDQLKQTRQYKLPMLRGPIEHTRVVGQRFAATVRVAESGKHTVSMKTQSGRAKLWLDLNGDGNFTAGEQVIGETPNTEALQSNSIELEAGRDYALRIDHISGLPRPVVLAYLEGPGIDGRKEITAFMPLLDGE